MYSNNNKQPDERKLWEKYVFSDWYDFKKNAKIRNQNGVSEYFLEEYFDNNIISWYENNNENKKCFNCLNCWNCVECDECLECYDCIGCSNCENCEECDSCINCSCIEYCSDYFSNIKE